MSEQKDILESLVNSPGWHDYVRFVEREWGPTGLRYLAQIDRALDLVDNDAAASQARQIRSAQKVILGLLRWPHEEIKRLTVEGEAEIVANGRAPMPMGLAGQSRRGMGL